jgi:hypothetical protein
MDSFNRQGLQDTCNATLNSAAQRQLSSANSRLPGQVARCPRNARVSSKFFKGQPVSVGISTMQYPWSDDSSGLADDAFGLGRPASSGVPARLSLYPCVMSAMRGKVSQSCGRQPRFAFHTPTSLKAGDEGTNKLGEAMANPECRASVLPMLPIKSDYSPYAG